ncbi:MAG: ATP-dependent DNA helicase RecG [Candidatus Collierbacteria bacterium GW2011_GWB1_44_6]|uniref:ATP-dependent DNA helicase RecG n=2 Tax=Candidatus Collieribacteriota TaxID=1752725 RepID=A0A0G1MMX1_9BACT|nr:MAG: ATP-dependent DNA helicase RecG [Candidatus Collierbacteria bacterium GW2011_GWC2_43_12]KKT73364.1 MAG: ATP-dependent DNA helicase RecG [Candidatus Collierbacteria bacterium GW2011_GWB1_44_6]KKT83340.1 MAG: ATP-dependent DNA helicase RecG [Microgenomates group bacterium GW2011_GWC1_44_9]
MISHYYPGDSITSVKGIGPSFGEKLRHLNISTVGDLLKHFPSRYVDFTKQIKISDLVSNTPGSFLAEIDKPTTHFSTTHKLITQAKARDETGSITLTWFNNPYIKKIIQEKTLYNIAGKPTFFGRGLTIVSPIIEEGDSFTINTKGLVPTYPQTEGVTSRWLRKKIHDLLHLTKLTDPISGPLLFKNSLLPLPDAIFKLHFPAEKDERWQADKRLSYNEHLRINITNRLEQEQRGKSPAFKSLSKIDTQTSAKLPFTLTAGQVKVLTQVKKDLNCKEFTHRLIQGETGSGKTAPLIFAANQCLHAGYSCAILAPTEILARQHYNTFSKFSIYPNKITLVTASLPYLSLKAEPYLFIGTHALLNQIPTNISPPLAFIAIDEQHKFGVTQREALLKRTPLPHLFNLSATPIPRTVALGLLGDIEISSIKERPSNRLTVKTFVVTPSKFKDSPKWLISKLESGNQIFVVCPNILEHTQNISSVEKQAQVYRRLIPNKFPIFTLHGKMASDEQQDTLQRFKDTPSSLLIATSLIEVGIDIPSANIMIIHSAERFGLAALHQLRGRVGRGEEQAYCFLVPSSDDEIETERLQLLQKYHDGLVLAQKDLRLRGAGEIYGEKQHGGLQTRLKYFWSKKLFLLAKADSKKIVEKDKSRALQIASKLNTW